MLDSNVNIETCDPSRTAAVAQSVERQLDRICVVPLKPVTFRSGDREPDSCSTPHFVVHDEWSEYVIWSLFNLGRNEEAAIIARQRAASGVVGPLFAFLNASGQSEILVRYFEDSWASLDAFQQAVPAHVFGYREMADIAFAYRRTGNQTRFDEAMTALQTANEQTFSQGMRGAEFLMVMAAYHAMAGDPDQALEWLAQAVDGGMIVSTRISKEYPYFSELDGDPEYEAIQSRMIEHLNAERQKLGLEPVST